MNINSIKSFHFPTNKFGILVMLMILCFGQSLAQSDFDGITYAKGKKGISFKKNGEMIVAIKPKMEDVKVLYRTYKTDFPLLYLYQLEGK